MKRIWRGVFSVVLLGMLAACASLSGPRTVEVPLSSLQAAMEKRFPFNSRYLELFDVRLGTPRLRMQADDNRVAAGFDAAIAPLWTRRAWSGNLLLSGRLALDPSRNAVVLTDARVETLRLNGLDSETAAYVERIGGLMVEQVFEGMVLYTFRPEELRYGGWSFLPSKINTHSNGLVVTFEPVK